MSAGRLGAGGSSDCGATLVEVLLAAVLLVSLAALAVPFTAQAADSTEARAAAAYLAGRVRQARLQALSGNRGTALLFDSVDGQWVMRRCVDGNGNGVRRADITSGRDSCDSGGQHLTFLFPGINLGLAADVPGVEEPPGNTSGVRFGRSGMVSCSPAGHCSAGTLYLRSEGGQQFSVRVAGVTGRTRLLRFDPGTRVWMPV